MAQSVAASGGAPLEGQQTLAATVSRKRLIFVVVGVMLGMLLGALDQTIVGTAMPRVIAELGGLSHYSWVFTGYLLASTVMVPIYGKLSDIYGRRLFFMGGMVLFLLGSALSGTSQDMTQLIIYRAIQGLGAGALMPIAQAIIGDVFPPSERGKWQGLMMAVFGLATIVGPTAGGWITDNWGWRWVFYVNMPVGVVALLTTGLAMPKVMRKQHKVDILGSLALVFAAVPLLLAFSLGGTTTDGVAYNWTSTPILAMFAVSVVFWVLFFVRENVASEPIISPRLFKNGIFTVSSIATFLLSAGMFGAILYLPLFVQGVIGDSATNSGVVLTPMMLGFIASSVIGGQLMSRTGRYKFLALVGFAVAIVGMWLLSQMSVSTSEGLVIRNMIITGLGIGVEMSLFTIVVQNAFPFRQLGEVTASLQFFRSIGGTIGTAVMGTILTNSFTSTFQAKLPATIKAAVPASQLSQLSNPQVLLAPGVTAQIQHGFDAFGPQGQALFQQLMEAMRSSLATAITQLFLLGAGAMVLAFMVTLFLREIPLRRSHKADEGAIAEAAPTDGDAERATAAFPGAI